MISNNLEEFTNLIAQVLAHYEIAVAGTSHINTLWNTAARAYTFPAEGDGIRPDYRYDEPFLLLHHKWIDLHQQVIGQKHLAALHAAVDRTATHMGAIAKTRASYGFIHADLHPGNFVSNGQTWPCWILTSLGAATLPMISPICARSCTMKPASRPQVRRFGRQLRLAIARSGLCLCVISHHVGK